jgi:glutathione S-transferase
MKLYYSPGSCALSPHIVALESGQSLELAQVDLAKKEILGGGDYFQVNGKGSVPALALDDGNVLTEGPAIIQFLADRKPELGLAPANGSFARYRLQEWLNFISTELHKGFSPLFDKTISAEMRDKVVQRLEKKLAWTSSHLEGKPFVMGDRFTVADAYLFTVLRWSRGFKIDLSRWHTLKDYYLRVAARPKVQEAMRAQNIEA